MIKCKAQPIATELFASEKIKQLNPKRNGLNLAGPGFELQTRVFSIRP